jgi:hypothetical protein
MVQRRRTRAATVAPVKVTNPPAANYTRSCGCTYRYDILPNGWERCDRHNTEETVEQQLEQTYGMPKCPECKSDARRQKCMWEMGGGCPRHLVNEKWDQMKRAGTAYALLQKELADL